MFSKLKNSLREFRQLYLSKNMLIILALGFGSGVPFALVFNTYKVYLFEEGINLSTIGNFGLAALPFTIKFIWSPLVDGLKIPFLCRMGQRRSWLLLSQILLMISISSFGFVDPKDNTYLIFVMAMLLAFFSATYDIPCDAIRVEILKQDQQGAGSAVTVMGSRIGALSSGGLSLIIAELFSWKITFIVMAASYLICILATIFAPEPEKDLGEIVAENSFKKWVKMFVVEPFLRFISEHKNWLVILLFAMSYKIGDALLGKMAYPFYFEMGFTKIEVAEISKFFGFAMTVIGGMVGGWIVYKIGVLRSLIIFGFLQLLGNLCYIWQANAGHDVFVMITLIIVENTTGAMATAAFTAYLSSLCNVRYTVTQYALLTSFMSFGNWLTNAPSGYLVDKTNGLGLSWEMYFIITVVISIPGLVLIKYLKINDKQTA